MGFYSLLGFATVASTKPSANSHPKGKIIHFIELLLNVSCLQANLLIDYLFFLNSVVKTNVFKELR